MFWQPYDYDRRIKLSQQIQSWGLKERIFKWCSNYSNLTASSVPLSFASSNGQKRNWSHPTYVEWYEKTMRWFGKLCPIFTFCLRSLVPRKMSTQVIVSNGWHAPDATAQAAVWGWDPARGAKFWNWQVSKSDWICHVGGFGSVTTRALPSQNRHNDDSKMTRGWWFTFSFVVVYYTSRMAKHKKIGKDDFSSFLVSVFLLCCPSSSGHYSSGYNFFEDDSPGFFCVLFFFVKRRRQLV